MLGGMDPITGPAEVAPAPPRWRRTPGASVLSLLVAGTGRLFNRQPRKGFILALVAHLLEYLLAYPTVMLSVPAMIAALTASAVWKIVVIFDVGYFAAKPKTESPVPLPRLIYALLIILMIAASLFPSWDAMKRKSGFPRSRFPLDRCAQPFAWATGWLWIQMLIVHMGRHEVTLLP